jgi:hypothetical protein
VDDIDTGEGDGDVGVDTDLNSTLNIEPEDGCDGWRVLTSTVFALTLTPTDGDGVCFGKVGFSVFGTGGGVAIAGGSEATVVGVVAVAAPMSFAPHAVQNF